MSFSASRKSEQVDANTVLLLHMDGDDGSQVFTDISSKSQPITVGGDAQVDDAQSKFGNRSLLLDGDGDYLKITGGTSDMAFGTGPFTIDFWMRPSSTSMYMTIIDCRDATETDPNSILLFWSPETVNHIYMPYPGAAESSTAFSTDTWYHIALVGDGGADDNRHIYLFVNGSKDNGFTYTGNYNITTTNFRMGVFFEDDGYWFTGWMDEVRVSTVARWINNFPPPISAYGVSIEEKLLDSSTLFKITNYTTDALTIRGDGVIFPAQHSVPPVFAEGGLYFDTSANKLGIGSVSGWEYLPASGVHIIQEEGVSLPGRSKLNFIGTSVVAEDNAVNDATDITISTGGSVTPTVSSAALITAYGLFR
jgi:hypothetical protein